MGWPGRFTNMQRCGGMSMFILRTKDPLEIFVERGFSSKFQVSEALRYDLSCSKRIKTHSILRSLTILLSINVRYSLKH